MLDFFLYTLAGMWILVVYYRIASEFCPVSKPPAVNRTISTEKLVLNIGLGLIALILTFAGLLDVFPLPLNLFIYLAGLVATIWLIWRWENLARWTFCAQVATCIVAAICYCYLFSFPFIKQYEKENDIRLVFKMSPVLTPWRELIIQHDWSYAGRYLQRLGITLPTDIPPIGIQTKGGGDCGESTPPKLPMYRGVISVGIANLSDRQANTGCFVDYVMVDFMKNKWSNDIHALMFSFIVDKGVSSYLNASFWDKTPPLFKLNPYADMLWRVREQVGTEFADNLAASTAKALADDSTSFNDKGIDYYFMARIKVAESIVDNECDEWPVVWKAFSTVFYKAPPLLGDQIRNQNLTNVSAACVAMWKQP